jgi:hypothetical protein
MSIPEMDRRMISCLLKTFSDMMINIVDLCFVIIFTHKSLCT